MIRFLLSILIIILCIITGYLLSAKYEKRKLYYDNFNEFIINYQSIVSYNQQTLNNYIKKNQNKNLFLEIIYDKIINKKEVSCKYLLKEDKILLNEFIDNIGKNCAENEIKIIENYKNQIAKYQESSSKDYQKNKNVFIKIGFLIGIMISIIII